MIYAIAVPLLIGLALALFIADQRTKPADDLHWLGKILLVPWLYLGLALDIALNVLLASIAFAELPREWTLSARVKRHERDSAGYRYRLATWICEGFLRPVDRDHC